MDQQTNDLEPSTSSSALVPDQSEVTSNLIRLPKVVLNRIDEQTLLSFKSSTPTKSKKRKTKETKVSDKVKKVLKRSLVETNDTVVKRPRGRPRKIPEESSHLKKTSRNLKLGVKNKNETSNKKSSMVKKNNLSTEITSKTETSNKKSISKKNNLKLGEKNKTISISKKLSKENVQQSKSGKLLKKTMLQKRSKVVIPLAKKTKVFSSKGINPKSPTEGKPSPPKPKLEIIQSKSGENSSDTSGDEFLYDELIEELESTASKRIIDEKPVQEKTTITLKPNSGNKPPTVLKGGIIKRTDLPSDLNLFAPSDTKSSNVISNGLQKTKHSTILTPGGKRKNTNSFGHSGPAKKSSPWPVAFVPSPKKNAATSLNSQKKKGSTTKMAIPHTNTKPTFSPKTTSAPLTKTEALPEPSYQSKSVTLNVPKAKIGPKQTAKVVPLSKSFDAEDYLSDEYLEEETLECDLEVEPLSKETQFKSNAMKSNLSPTKPSQDHDANLDLLKILTDESEEPITANLNEAKEKKPVKSNVDIKTSSVAEKSTPHVPTDISVDSATVNQTVDVENEEPPVRTIYDLMNEVFLDYPSWNLHLIPETSAFCIAQVTKGRLGLPTLKKCIELDPASYSAKVYIHQYHIKRFDGVYDGEESILALIREIDSIKA